MKDIKKIIEESIQEVQSHEIVLVTGRWGVQWNVDKKKWEFEDPYSRQCCALGAVLLKHQPPQLLPFSDPFDVAASFFDVNEDYICKLISGFDCPASALDCQLLNDDLPDPYKLGAELNEKFKPVEISTSEDE